jgi:hypothetical protein
MPNVGAVIREEITRLSRKESRSQVDATKKATAQHRRDIATLKRQVTQLERQMVALSRKLSIAPPTTEAPSGSASSPRLRFAAKGLRSQRERLGLSQTDFGRLLGVSAQSIYNWERALARPRDGQIAKIVAVRSLGKRQAAQLLKQLSDGKGKRKTRGR